MSNVKDGDIFMVSRDGTEFQVKNEDTSNLRDDDLFWVQRDGVNYSVTAEQVNTGGAAQAPIVDSVLLAKTTSGERRFTDQQFQSVPSYLAAGNPIPQIGLKSEVKGSLGIAGATDEIIGISQQTLTLTSNGQTGWEEGGSYSTSVLTGISGVGSDTGKSLYSQIKEDGDLMDTRFVMNYNDNAAAYINIVYNPPIVTDSLDVYSGIYSTSPSDTGTITVTFDDGSTSVKNVSGGANYNMDRHIIPTDGKAVVSIRCDGYYSNYGGASTGGRDGLVFNSDNTILTLASDVNLTNGVFRAGDAVKQNNSPLIPTTSAITNVDKVVKPPIDYVSYCTFTENAPSQGPDNAFDGAISTVWYTSVNTYQTFTYTIPCSKFEVYIHLVELMAEIIVNGTSLNIASLGLGNGWHDFSPYLTDGEFRSFSAKRPGGSPGISAFRVDDEILVNNTESTNTTLTLTNSDGLSDFAVDDVVQEPDGIIVFLNKARTDTEAAKKKGSAYRMHLDELPTGSQLYNIEELFGGFPEAIKVGGTVQIWGYPDIDGTVARSIGTYNFTEEKTASEWHILFSSATANYYVGIAAYWSGFQEADGYDFGPTGEGDIVITAINPNEPSVSTSGGTWNVGDVVTGPQVDITATFVSADPSVPSMEVSDLVGPWSANTGNYAVNTVVNPVLVTPITDPIASITNSVASRASTWDTGVAGYSLSNGNKTSTATLGGVYPFMCIRDNFGEYLEIGKNQTMEITLSGAPGWSNMIFTTVLNPTASSNTDRGGYVSGGTYGWAASCGGQITMYQNGSNEFQDTDFGPETTQAFNLSFKISRNAGASTQTWIVTNLDTQKTVTQVFNDTTDGPVYFGYTSNNTIDVVTINEVEPVILGLEGTKDLVYFQKGDVVQDTTVGSALLDNAWPIAASVYADMTWAEFTADQSVEYGPVTGYQAFNFDNIYTFKYASDRDRQVYFYFGQNQDNGQSVIVGGNVNNPGTQVITGNTGGSPSKIFIDLKQGVSTFTLEINDSQVYCYGRSAFGTKGVSTEVISTDLNAPSMTVSGGTWNVGQVVTTDTKEILTSTASLKFDLNGNVSGVSAGSTDYVLTNAVNPTLIFPSTFSDGKTPDETLPEGTSIQTQIKAFNESGESTAKSNVIVPSLITTRLSKGETKLIDGYTPVATAAARQTLAEAQKIEDKITRATDNLQIAIYRYEEQGKRRSV